jgi:hypothetical protein
VLDKFDYAKLLTERDGMLDYVTFLLRDSHILYVGFGLDDPTFNQMETRLQTLHGENRPPSFAFIPAVTDKEREVWQGRNLEIIDYGGYESLPAILRCVNTIQGFVIWAEEKRGRGMPNDDRTTTYWADALRLYVKGDFVDGLKQCRAALASTLFWEREPAGGPDGKKILPFDRAAKLCEIRIRMARFHYKLRWTVSDLSVHDKPMYENIAAAGKLIEEQKQRLALPKKRSPDDERVLLALGNSLKIINARASYLKGEFKDAWDSYSEVVKSVSPEEIDVTADDSKTTIITKLKLAEGFYYAKCQMSRLEYQFIDLRAADRRAGRQEQVELMLEVERAVDGICDFLKAREEACSEYPEWEYYYNSLWTIRRISMWTAGRQASRACKDLIPTVEERTRNTYDELTKALEYLAYEKTGTLWPLSARWPALRYRYQCRAYALRWLVGQHLGERQCDEDILKAFRAIQEGLQNTGGPGLERQRVINLLEAARLNIIAMFGEKLRRRGRGPMMDASPLTISAGLHYLDDAFMAIDGIPEKGPDEWLLALGYRLASYLYVVAGDGLAVVTEGIRSEQLRPFLLEKDAEAMAAAVEEEYRRFATALGDPHAFDKRIQYFTYTFGSIREELAQPPG